jgi:predicted nucleic acid-binding protein
MIVTDAGTLVQAVVREPIGGPLRTRLSFEPALHAPHLVDLEFLSAMRGLVLATVVTAEQATLARAHYGRLRVRRYEHLALADRVWQLRHDLTTYDAAYAALAEALDAALVTTDGRLARATGLRCQVELVPLTST